MNRTKTNEEKEWREASHPRLVKRLEDQRTALADLNRQVQVLTAKAEAAEVELNKWRDACCANCLHSPCMCLVHDLEVERDALAAKVAELQTQVSNYAGLWIFVDSYARFKASEKHGEWMAALASQSKAEGGQQ